MSSNSYNINNLKNIFTQFAKNLLKLQEQQTKLTKEILKNISLNEDNLHNNININNIPNISQSQNNLELINNEKEESEEYFLSKNAIYKKDDGNKDEDTNKNEIKHKIQQKKIIKKRAYNEMMENGMSIDEDSSKNFKFNKKNEDM